MRLNAYLARAGVASRRGADELIKAGRVTVNGEAGQLNTFVESRDRVQVNGHLVELQPLAYVLLHKPAGVVTTAHDPQGRRTVVDLVEHPARVVPVGRLDADTDRGAPAHERRRARAPARPPALRGREGLRGRGRGRALRRALEQLRWGIELDDGPTAPAQARVARPSAGRALAARRPQAPGQANARRRRPPRSRACTGLATRA